MLNSDVVFFDPDNGIEVSYSRTSQKGTKYVYFDELEPYYKRGQSLIIYNHRSMQPEDEYLERFRKLRDIISPAVDIFYLRFRPFSVRDFVFVLQEGHGEVKKRAREIIKTTCPWSKHFEYYDLN